MLFVLLWTFFKIGWVSFGGGYAMIPVMEREVYLHGWMTETQFTDLVTIAAMAPGPIAVNCAVLIGYEAAGIWGAAASGLGIMLPSLIIMLLFATVFFRIRQHKLFKSALYALQPVIAALIFFAAVRFAQANQWTTSISWQSFGLFLIFLLSLYLLFRSRLHPLGVIVLSGFIGILFFS